MFTFITSVVQKFRASGRRSASALRRAQSQSQISPCIKFFPPSPSPISPVVSLDVRPPSVHSECVEVSDRDNYDVAEDEMFAKLHEMFSSDDETFTEADEDSVEQVESGETRTDHLSPAMSYDHEAEDGFALWLAATNLFDGEPLGGEEADRSVSEVLEDSDVDFSQVPSTPNVVNATDDAVLADVNSLRSVHVVESGDIHTAEEQTVEVVMPRDTLISTDASRVDSPLAVATMPAYWLPPGTEEAVVAEAVKAELLRIASVEEAEALYTAQRKTGEMYGGSSSEIWSPFIGQEEAWYF